MHEQQYFIIVFFCKAPALNIVHVNTVQVVVSELARECTLMIGPFAAISIIDGLSIWMIIQALQRATSLQRTIYMVSCITTPNDITINAMD